MLWFVAGLVIVVAMVLVIGMLLPVSHTAAVRIALGQPVERVFDVIADLPEATQWRSDLKSVQILSGENEPLRWRETTGFGAVIMKREESRRPLHLVARIDDPDQPFGGRWIYALEPAHDCTVLTITEHGEIYVPSRSPGGSGVFVRSPGVRPGPRRRPPRSFAGYPTHVLALVASCARLPPPWSGGPARAGI